MVLTLCHFSSCHHSIVEAKSTREHRRVLSLLCCSAGVEETGCLACPFCGKAPREAAASWESALTSFTPHLLFCAHHPKQSVGARSRRKIYGAGHLSMSLLFPPLFFWALLTEMLHDFLKVSFLFFCVKNLSWSSGSPPTPKKNRT